MTITEILSSNSLQQGDYGTGFTSDLSGIELPLTLAPGERVVFPVQPCTSSRRLTVRGASSTAGGRARASAARRLEAR